MLATEDYGMRNNGLCFGDQGFLVCAAPLLLFSEIAYFKMWEEGEEYHSIHVEVRRELMRVDGLKQLNARSSDLEQSILTADKT